jgi:NAD(P)H-dependent FMN reductase
MSEQKSIDLNSSLSSLAMLSVQLSAGKDYLHYLNGFVIEALRTIQSEGFDAVAVQKAVDHQFGLRIPAATFAIVLKRLVKDKIIKTTVTGLQYCVAKLPNTTVSKDREVARARIKEVTDELARFAHSQYSLVWDDRTSAQAIAEFLRKYSIDFLRFAEAKSPLPKEADNPKTTDYVVASFITNCAKDHPGLFESIKVLVQSHILANALMCPDLEKTPRGFKEIHFLADTRFLLKALDLESRYDTDNARQLLAAIRTLKGVVCVFPETKDELRTVLKGIIKRMQQGTGHGAVCRELLKRGRGVADVILAESNLDQALASLSISILPSPLYEESNYLFQIDETDLRDEIESEVDYISDRAAEHDIRVVRHIYALRRGRKASTIEDSRFVLLTTNAALSRAAFNYEKKNSSSWFFSAVVTDYHLSHLAWLKSPMEVPDLPRAEILASCYATMKPPKSLWDRYLTELDRLKTENKMSERDHEVLRFSVNAANELMEVTRGDVEGITDKNLHIVLEKLEKTFATEKEQALQRERIEHEKTKAVLAEIEQSTQKNVREKEESIRRQAALEQAKASQETELQKLKQIGSEAKAKEERTSARIDRLANGIAQIAFYASGVVFAIISGLAVFGNLSIWFAIPAALVGFFNIWCGFSGNTVELAVKNWIAKRLTGLMN